MVRQRKFLGVLFECCGAYARIYKNKAGDVYEGRCPRCGRRVRVRIDPQGVRERFFVARPIRMP